MTATASNRGDSEDPGQVTPDTDDSGAHSEGFKRAPAPVMGHRGLEQRGKKSRTYPPKEQPNSQKVRLLDITQYFTLLISLWTGLVQPACYCVTYLLNTPLPLQPADY